METNSSGFCESFETLRHQIVRTLHQNGYVQHQALNITIEHGTVTVEGSVPTWYLRQIALERVRRVAGVVRVVDRIRVVRESQDDNLPCFDATGFIELPDAKHLPGECG